MMSGITAIEITELESCESVIRAGLNTFVEVGTALMTIRDKRLYRASHGTFEDYCREKWGMKQSRAYQMMDAAATVASLKSSTIVELPANEAQARPLTRVPSEQRAEVWQTVEATAPDGKITAAHVQNVVDVYRLHGIRRLAQVTQDRF
jgi:hypothetical protein